MGTGIGNAVTKLLEHCCNAAAAAAAAVLLPHGSHGNCRLDASCQQSFYEIAVPAWHGKANQGQPRSRCVTVTGYLRTSHWGIHIRIYKVLLNEGTAVVNVIIMPVAVFAADNS